MTATSIRRPDGASLDWHDVDTWFCFDCGDDAAASYVELDGYVRCADCTAVWQEHHLDAEDWR